MPVKTQSMRGGAQHNGALAADEHQQAPSRREHFLHLRLNVQADGAGTADALAALVQRVRSVAGVGELLKADFEPYGKVAGTYDASLHFETSGEPRQVLAALGAVLASGLEFDEDGEFVAAAESGAKFVDARIIWAHGDYSFEDTLTLADALAGLFGLVDLRILLPWLAAASEEERLYALIRGATDDLHDEDVIAACGRFLFALPRDAAGPAYDLRPATHRLVHGLREAGRDGALFLVLAAAHSGRPELSAPALSALLPAHARDRLLRAVAHAELLHASMLLADSLSAALGRERSRSAEELLELPLESEVALAAATVLAALHEDPSVREKALERVEELGSEALFAAVASSRGANAPRTLD